MRTRLFICVAVSASLVLIAPGLRAAGQQQVADLAVTLLISQADKASLALNLDEAMAHVDQAIALAEKLGDRVGLAMALRTKGLVLIRVAGKGDAGVWYGKALSEFEALNNRAGIADALAGLAAASAAVGDTAKAKEHGDRALQLFKELGDDRGRGFMLSILARSAAPALRNAYVKEILEIADRLQDNPLRATGLRQLGTIQFDAGNFAGARVSLEGAIQAYETIGDIESLAACYLNLGRVFRAHGDYEGALQRYQKAIDLLAPTKERFTIVEAVNSASVALGYLNRKQEALAFTERGLALARESGNQRLIDFMEGNLAGSLGDLGQHERAVVLLEAVIARKPEPYLAPYRYQALANELVAVGRTAEALEPMNEALRLTREQKQIEILPARLDAQSGILTKLGRFEEALTDSREAMSLVEQVRTRLVPSDFLKRGYADRVQLSYVRIVDLLSRLGRGAEALEFAEQGRARAFLDLLAARETNETSLATRGGPPLPASDAGLASESMGKPIGVAEMGHLAKRLGSTIVTYWVDDNETLVWVVRPDGVPTHMRLPVTREKLTALVTATTAPLRETAKATTTRGAEDAQGAPAVATDADLTSLPMRGLGLLALTRDDKSAWQTLYRTLIEPVRTQLPARGGRVTIVPHGPLFQLSFAALMGATGRYLVEDYQLHYAPAISALDYTGRRQQAVAGNANAPWAVIGNPVTLPVVGDRPLPPLPGAAREITAISALAPRGSALRLSGQQADEAALNRLLGASHPSVLHFATHGFVFDDAKKAPFLALNRRGSTDADDGRLTLDEVYGLHLTTDLVVLSACRSGTGRVSSDGIVGLTRGFFYAGSPSVMATFWDVTDEATANLMSNFYRHYAKARAKGSSLRAAQLALLADLRAGKIIVTAGGRKVTLPEHPLLWAAFFLSGEP